LASTTLIEAPHSAIAGSLDICRLPQAFCINATMLGLLPERTEQIEPSVHTSWQNNGNGIDPLVLNWPLQHLKAGLPEV